MANTIGLWPFFNAPGLSQSLRVIGSGVQTGMIVGPDTITTEAGTCVPCTSGGRISYGVITTPQGDPNNGGFIPSGTVVDVTYTGIVPVLLHSGDYSKGDPIVASTVFGQGKELSSAESGAPMMVIGIYADLPQAINASGQPLLSVQLTMSPTFR